MLGSPVTIPAGNNYWLYTEAGAELRDASGLLRSSANFPVGAGRPVDSSLDLESGWGVIVYERSLGVVQLAEAETTWYSHAGPAIERVAVRGELFATLSGDDVDIRRVADGKPVRSATSGRAWLDSQGLEELRFALPLSDAEILVVGHKPRSVLSYPKTTIARIDLSGGNWRQVASEDASHAIHDIDVVESDGSAIYLAGKIVAMRSRAKMTPDQALEVLRYDVGRRELRTLVDDDRLATKTQVLDLAVGQDLIALILDGGVLAAYRVHEDRRTSSRVLHDTEHPLPVGARLGWASASSIVVIRGDALGIELREIR